jgi:hypothetical protein
MPFRNSALTEAVYPARLNRLRLPQYGLLQEADEFFSSVSWLMNFVGTEGSTTFTDSSSFARTVTAAGAPSCQFTITTSNPPPGCSSSLTANGTFNSRLTVPNATASLQFDGDFTIETFLRPAGSGEVTFGSTTSGGQNVQLMRVNANDSIFFFINGSPNITSSVGLVTRNAWAHYALVRDSGQLSAYFAGTRIGSPVTNTTTFRWDILGNFSSSTSTWNGQIGPSRGTKGIVRYRGTSFTPPVGPFPTF